MDETATASSGHPLVLPLHALGRGNLAVAGGKGANLGELVRAGLPVPAGFVITTAAYDRVVAANKLDKTIVRALRAGPEPGTAIRAGFAGAVIPQKVKQDILAAQERLGPGRLGPGRLDHGRLGPDPLAVRSSATTEDLPEAAFAGQQDTFLNVLGADALLDAVRQCWASLWSDRAIAYRGRLGFDQQKAKLAVVVQRMVPAEAAGVLFTANPVTGAREEIVIESNPGLGDAVVSGLATPDHFVLRKRRWGWAITERRIGRHEIIVQPRAAGGTERISAATPATSRSALSDRALRRFARLGAAIERHFGTPQDIEWVWTGREPFIVQTRPMTALPEPVPRLPRLMQMLAAMFAEMFPIRPYPLDLTTWVAAVSEAVVAPMFSLIGVAAPPIEHLFVVDDGVVVRFRGSVAVRPTAGILLAPLRLLGLIWRYDPVRARADPTAAEARSRARALEKREIKNLSAESLLAIVRDALTLPRPLAGEIRRRYLPRALFAAALLRVVLALLGQGKRWGTLLSGAESMTREANRALEGLAAQIRSDPALADAFANYEPDELRAVLQAEPAGRSFRAALNAFLDLYGHREVVLSTALKPTWKDAPEVVLGILKGLALTEPRDEKEPWEVARSELLAHPLLRLSLLRSAILRLLAAARSLWQIREDTHFDATRILPILRRALLELGRRLTEVDILDAPEDVFHLRREELERVAGTWPPPAARAAELRAIVARRKERRATLEGTPVVDPRLYRLSEPSGGALLHGTAGSPGVREGPVRVILNDAQFGRLRPGDVLVAPYTNPAWTPLFQRAVAVVVDAGAAGSHAAIVAREYGIPAVMGTIDGTRRLVDGQAVRVDGDRGLVFPAS